MKYIKYLTLIVILTLFSISKSYAILGLEFGIKFGLATPNDNISNVYNSNNINTILKGNDSLNGQLLKGSTSSGFNISGDLKLGLGKGFKLYGGIGINRFTKSTLLVKDPNTDKILTTISTTQNIIPIEIGISYQFLDLKLIKFYFNGGITNNYYSQSIDIPQGDITIPIKTDNLYSRIGSNIGIGTDINAEILTGNLQVKYNFANLIGAQSGEQQKSYLNVLVGVYF